MDLVKADVMASVTENAAVDVATKKVVADAVVSAVVDHAAQVPLVKFKQVLKVDVLQEDHALKAAAEALVLKVKEDPVPKAALPVKVVVAQLADRDLLAVQDLLALKVHKQLKLLIQTQVKRLSSLLAQLLRLPHLRLKANPRTPALHLLQAPRLRVAKLFFESQKITRALTADAAILFG